MLTEPTLVLNRSWVAISTTTVRTALSLVYKGAARIIRPETYEIYDFQTWADLSREWEGPVIRGVCLRVPVPEVILLTRHDQEPHRRVPFSRRNLFRRDRNRCQYCGRRATPQELSIDHVVPRARGGRTTWTNCVLACIPCNALKGSRLLPEAGMSLIRRPLLPHWSPCIQISLGRRRASWERFVSEHYWNVTLDED